MLHMEQKRDLKMAIRILRSVSEGSPERAIGHCQIFFLLGNTCDKCPFIVRGINQTKCNLREAISYLDNIPERGESIYNNV